MKFRYLPLEQIVLSKNVRSEPDDDLGGLLASINRFEVLQPVLVRPRGRERYELISGHRRYQAVKMQGDSTIPCIIREDFTDRELPFIQLVENIQRKQLHPCELVKIFNSMLAATPGLTKAGIAALLGKSQAWIYDKYEAEKIYQSLLAEGLDEEVIQELSETSLKRLSHVAKAKERARIAGKLPKDRKNIREIIHRARSYRIDPRGPQHLLDMTGGFCVLIHSDRRLQVLCKSLEVRAEIFTELQRIKDRRTKAETSSVQANRNSMPKGAGISDRRDQGAPRARSRSRRDAAGPGRQDPGEALSVLRRPGNENGEQSIGLITGLT